MGKVATATTTTEMRRRKKKGRPSKTLAPSSPPSAAKPLNYSSVSNRRSTRRNPNFANSSNSTPPEFVDEEDDDDERKEKKVKLVVRLPQSDDDQQQHFTDSGSGSGSDSDPEAEDREGCAKKRKINAVGSRSDEAGLDQDKKVAKVTDTLHGSPLETGPTTPLPDKKLLVFILDRLQKKDTYGVFSEPVDPEELPDYHEIIERPMDFGTVRRKLEGGSYKCLEELEADVFLICSNAMQYNAPDTVYFRQARSIQELAKRDFENLKHEGDNGEPQPKVVRRGRPPSKNLKKPLETSPADRVGPEQNSGATLASGEEKSVGSNNYNLRKAPVLHRFRSTDTFPSPYRTRNGENNSEWSVDWNDEFPASILRADMKYGKKNFQVDENRRDTYRQFHPSSSSSELSVLSNASGDVRRLMPVGVHADPLAYARSLARFAANLGPVAWKIASKKIESVLPPGVKYGPGWVGEYEAPSQPFSFSSEKQILSNSSAGDCHSSRQITPSTSDLNSAVAYRPSEEMVEAVRKLNSLNESAVQDSGSSWRPQGSSFQPLQKPVNLPQRNGFSGMFGYSQAQPSVGVGIPRHSGLPDASVLYQMPEMVSRENLTSTQPNSTDPVNGEETKPPSGSWNALDSAKGQISDMNTEGEVGGSGKSSWQALPTQQRHSLSIPPDLNVRVQAGSPSSSLQIGSPQQPDLALQL